MILRLLLEDIGSASLVSFNDVWYVQVVNIRIHYSKKLKELSDKLAESKNEQTKLKLAAENAAQLNIPPFRTIKVCGPFWIHIDSSWKYLKRSRIVMNLKFSGWH